MVPRSNVVGIYVALCFLALQIMSQEEQVTTTKKPTMEEEALQNFNRNESYCFRFTWLGPQFDNQTDNRNVENSTCQAILDDGRTRNVPCKMPLVITDNGAPPDVQYMWDNYKMRVACKMSKGKVCAKYSYFFDNKVQNVTYMCTKVYEPVEGAIRSGCYRQVVGGDEVELCICESGTGDYVPCNKSYVHFTSISLLLLSILPFVLFKV